MSYIIDFVPGLDRDLEDLAVRDPPAAALWIELIDLIYDNERVCAELTVSNGYRPFQPRFDTVPVRELLRRGYNISRVKLYRADMTPHAQRLLYALDHRNAQTTIVLLGLMPRHEDYELSNHHVRRAADDYDALGIPRVPIG